LNNLAQRTITGLIGAFILLFGVIYSEPTFLMLLLLISSLSLLEFYKINESENCHPQKIFGLIINFIIFLPPIIQNIFQTGFNILPLIIILPYIIFIRELYIKKGKPVYNISVTLLGVLYISLPLFCFYLISFQGVYDNYQWGTILGFFLIMWANDVGAYFAGRFLGKHKLFERISPKKTWEGVVGGVILAFITAYVASMYLLNFPKFQWFAITAIIVLTATLGDLVESMFKRSVNIKDSSAVLPGHGGFLDRFDGLFISAPFVFFYLQLWR
jgi:phosphatidate cytidylyltransferase